MNAAALQAYLNAPIPRKFALFSSWMLGISTLGYMAQARYYEKQSKASQTRLVAMKEFAQFLLEKGAFDNEDLRALNEKIDFWGIALEIDVNRTKTGTAFEEEFGYDVELAQEWLTDVYKPPEMHNMCQEFLDVVKRLEEK